MTSPNEDKKSERFVHSFFNLDQELSVIVTAYYRLFSNKTSRNNKKRK